ncbi:MAG: ATP-binding protein [Treponemataceae bacterium]|nr:ATP-binding protein [Treponemataceae bacterium]
MERIVYKQLLEWKNSRTRKPFILQGARQVGKTWILKDFAKREYKNLAYISCENNERMRELFADYDTERIIRGISAVTMQSIIPGETLIFIDEIQEIPKAVSSLKYFCENQNEYHIAVAGSLLGIALHEGESFPVGKVDVIQLYPMNFEEFILALGKEKLLEILKSRNWNEISMMKTELIENLRMYYFTGGMPEVVDLFVKTQDIAKVRALQNRILADYALDISKHAPKTEIPKISLVWNSIPSHLAKENKKFVYGALRKGARAAQYEDAIQWLVNAGLAYKITRVSKAAMPLHFYEQTDVFKLFMHDCGLFGAMSKTPPDLILLGSKVFEEYKGAFTEQFVLQQLKAMEDVFIHYYTNDDSTLEIDFLLQCGNKILPVEVKAEENLQAKSMKSFLAKNPDLHGVRFSMSPYREQERMTNIPLYAVERSNFFV